MNGKTLVAYFSASGVTAAVAKILAGTLGADLHEIKPKDSYTAADLNWLDKHSRSTLEMTDPYSRPELAPERIDLSRYQNILIGYPVWWYVEPRIIDTFLESYDFTGKTLIPFATSGSSGIENSEESLKKHLPTGNWRPGKLLNLVTAAQWAKSL